MSPRAGKMERFRAASRRLFAAFATLIGMADGVRLVPPGPMALVALAFGLACSSEPASSGAPLPCDPLATVARPLAAAPRLGAGRDGAGRVYVVDSGGTEGFRLFVSSGTALQRVSVSGSGDTSSGAGRFVIVDAADQGAPVAVGLELDAAGVVVRMGVVHGPRSAKTFTIGQEGDGEVLTLLAPAALEAFTFVNLPGTVAPEYLASLPDGRRLLVTRPEVDWSYADFRLFLGPPARMLERKIANVSRGSFTVIDFTTDQGQGRATFGSPLSPSVVSAVEIAGQTLPLAVAPPGTRPGGEAFLCTSPSPPTR
jgi:hypothetical protein